MDCVPTVHSECRVPDGPQHAGRQALLKRLRIPSSYYTTILTPGVRLIALDTTEMSMHSGFSPVRYFDKLGCAAVHRSDVVLQLERTRA
jgi:hypothetical protein